MKVGDLVRPVPPKTPGTWVSSAPIVGYECLGIIIDFTSDFMGRHPIVYWNPIFQFEAEYPNQIEVIPCKTGTSVV
jgi:hypothetical protein